MAKKKKQPSIDFAALQQRIKTQFTGLDPNDPSEWPDLPRQMLLVGAAVAVVLGLWFGWLTGYEDELVAQREQENQLRQQYTSKLAQAVNLDALKQQLEQVQQYVTQLEKQLPSKAEMDSLLSDINQAGLGRSLQFELFRPGQVTVKQYYAELPISIRVTGRYHDIGSFAADIANLSRIVTLHNLSIGPVTARDASGQLAMESTARTYRYLDAVEVAEQQKKAAANKAKGAKK